jgi:hypothetical protein
VAVTGAAHQTVELAASQNIVEDHLAGRLFTQDRNLAGGAPEAERVPVNRVKHRELDLTQRIADSHRASLRSRPRAADQPPADPPDPKAQDSAARVKLGVIVRPERLDPPERLLMRGDMGAGPLLDAAEEAGELSRGRSVGILQIAVVQLLDLGEGEP